MILSEASKTVVVGVHRVERPLHSVEVEGLSARSACKEFSFSKRLGFVEKLRRSRPSNSSRDFTEGLCI